jgi:anti-anti-sigma factor
VDVDVRKDESAVIVSVTGRIDTISAPDLQQKLEEIVAQGEKRIVIDLSRLEYVSSAGLRSLLIGAQKTKASGGKLCCCALQGMVKQVFEISGFGRMIPIFDCVEKALE